MMKSVKEADEVLERLRRLIDPVNREKIVQDFVLLGPQMLGPIFRDVEKLLDVVDVCKCGKME